MAQVELIMPKMGESIMEATILNWAKSVGDSIEEEESVLEIATDKVDSEVPSPVEGTLAKILYEAGETVAVGKVIALIEVAGSSEASSNSNEDVKQSIQKSVSPAPAVSSVEKLNAPATANTGESKNNGFYSPLVLNIARQEGISNTELERIAGTGKSKRLTKKDILNYLKDKQQPLTSSTTPEKNKANTKVSKQAADSSSTSSIQIKQPKVTYGDNVEIIEMDRMRKLIADHMVMSSHVSPHVTSFIEVDMTNIVNWRNKVKKDFQAREGEKLSYTPIFVEAVSKAIKDYPMINSSVDGDKIIIRKDINIGMATATPTGNLIVPVIKNADYKNLIGLAKIVNDFAIRGRQGKLKPDEISNGTFTLSNVGTFGSVMGTPIINQPQVAILAVGAIRKKPAVLETEYGDVIAIRQLMMMSLSYDHRIVDGALGSTFLGKVAYYLENFDINRTI